MLKSILVASSCLLLTTAAFAQEHDHAALSMSSAKTDIYASAMEKMHKDMMIEPTGNADIDFVHGMIPHHQGAIDMAKILKEKGKDPELQKMADDIISAQEKEITFMKDWLKKHEKAE